MTEPQVGEVASAAGAAGGGERAPSTAAKNGPEQAVPPSLSPRNPRRVKFHASTKASSDESTDDPFGNPIPRRIKFGKGGKAAPLRDAFFLFSFVGLLIYLSQTTETGSNNEKKSKKSSRIAIADEMNKLQKTMQTMLMESAEKSRRKDACDLFTAKSSIPDTGQGVFAGRRFLKGEILHESSLTVPVQMNDGSFEPVASLAFSLKFHPTMSNVENVNTLREMKLRATHPIRAGEELFLPYEQHPIFLLSLENRTLFGHIPLASDYDVAELLQHDIKVAARRMEVAHSRRIQDAINLNTGYLYMLGAQVTARFAPNVAKLLPTSRTELYDRGELPVCLATLANQTLATLQLHGSCLGDVVPETSNNEISRHTFVKATRSVPKGHVVQTVPVHVFKHKQKISHPFCVWSDSREWYVCPLTDIAMALSAESSVIAGSSDEANVALKWTDEKAPQKLQQSGQEEAPAATMSMDLVALQPIEKSQRVGSW